MRRGNNYYSWDPWLRFAGDLAPYFSKVAVSVQLMQRLPGKGSGAPVCLNEDWGSGNVRWIEVSPAYYLSIKQYYRNIGFVLRRVLPTIWREIRGSDLVLLRMPNENAFFAFLIAKLHRKPLFCFFGAHERAMVFAGGKYRGIVALAALAVTRIRECLHRLIVKTSDGAFFNSLEVLEHLSKANATSHLAYPSMIRRDQVMARTHLTAGEPFQLLFVGRLSHEKGLADAIAALDMLVKSGANCSLKVCGRGPDEEAMRDLARCKGLSHLVDFAGFIPRGENLDRVYRQSGTLVVPSLSEGLPKVLLEAMANGLPIVATAVGGIPGLIQHMHNGILVPQSDPAAIAQAVKMLRDDPSLYKGIVQNALAAALDHTAEKEAEKMAGVMLRNA